MVTYEAWLRVWLQIQIDIANLGKTKVSSCSSDHILEDSNKIVPKCISFILWLWALISHHEQTT